MAATADCCANPLFLEWVKEWWDQAKERNTMGVLAYKNAYESLKACPIRFDHPDQLLALKGFGPKTCSRLMDKLVQHCMANDLPVPTKKRLPRASLDRIAATGRGSAAGAAEAPDGGHSHTTATGSNGNGTRKRKPYVPALRQGGYGIIMALSSSDAGPDGRHWLAKARIIELAQPHCDTSYTVKPPGKFYTAWDSIKTLLEKDLVLERGGRSAKRYTLTEDGWDIANKLRHVVSGGQEQRLQQPGRPPRADPEEPPLEDLVPDGPVVTADDALPDVEPIVLPPGSFSVQLVLDVRERVTGQRTYMEDELVKKGAPPLVRALSLGDALWVAKCHDPDLLRRCGGAEGDEVVLDWIVERKRQDDLIGSIKDGRFREQKFRLRRCGLRHVVYVIEESGLDPDTQHRYEEAMQSAVASTQVVNGYFVKKTHSVDETIGYLAKLTQMLARRYAHQPLHVIPTAALTAQNYLPLLQKLRDGQHGGRPPAGLAAPAPEYGITYAAFASLTSKSETLTLRDVFLKMLLCTRGVTGERALEIQTRWKTPYAFVQAFEQLEHTGGDNGNPIQARKRKRAMVFDALGGLAGPKRKVPKAVSEKLAEAWADALMEEA
ncbi:DNA repair protein [Niveomyces insectorum RCEF 264]|uniref:Crossover junction endonuclease MUS81 n=1 Tax=Niveomyces insectorum RCEF 264 TaxID=1081102 RepID=A0A167U539_9HYPO|nr:DNA repair protein [Niveomyces insectorum RCEF 264]